MNIQLWINGAECTSQLEYALQFTDTIDGGQDSGGFTLRNNIKTPFPQFSQVEVKIDGVSFFWYVGEDKVTQKSPSSLCIHNINIVERVRILEGYYISNITFTQPFQRDLALSTEIYTYKTAIERVLAITPLRIGGSGSYPKFNLDATIAAKLDRMEFPESFPSAKNLYEFMLNIGRLIGAVPYMTDWDRISFWFIDDANNEIPKPSYDNYFAEKTADQYCTNIDITLNNVITEDDEEQGTIIVPSPTGYMSTVEPSKIAYTKYGKDSVIALPSPIHKLKNVIWYGDCAIWQDGTQVFLGSREINITKRVLEKAQYEILPQKEKAKYLFFEYGGKEIGGIFYTYDTIFGMESTYAITQVVEAAFADDNPGKSLTTINESAWAVLYRVEYIPSIETLRCQIERKQDPTFRTQFSFAANQTDSAVSCRYAGKMYQQHIERIGKEARKYVEIIEDYLTELPQVGSYFVDNGDKFYLFKLNCQIVNPNKILLETFYSKDFTALSERIGLNALPRFTEITRDTSIRSDVYKEHCIISNTYQNSISAFYNYSSTGKTAGMRAAIWAEPEPAFIPSGRSQCNFAYVRTYLDTTGIQATNKPLLLPVSSIAVGNALSFSVSFKDNFSAGTQIRDVDASRKAYYDVRYTGINSLGGSFGKLTSIELDYISDTESGALDTLDKAQKLPEIAISDYSINRLWSLSSLLYLKDTREVPSINYMLCFEGSGTVVLGESFTRRNPLVSTDNIRFIPISSMERVAYVYASHTWMPNASGTYLRYQKAVYADIPSNRYKPYLSGYIQDNSGTYIKASKTLRMVYCSGLLSQTHTGAIEFDSIPSIAINKMYSIYDYIPIWWFGSDYDNYPAFNTNYKSWAIVDEYDNLVIGNNAQNFNPVYFNFTKEKTYENNI